MYVYDNDDVVCMYVCIYNDGVLLLMYECMYADDKSADEHAADDDSAVPQLPQ